MSSAPQSPAHPRASGASGPRALRDPLTPEPSLMMEALHQPDWQDHPDLRRVRLRLRQAPGLVTRQEVYELRVALSRVAQGDCHVIQAGDCAESLHECTNGYIADRVETLGILGDALARNVGGQVVRLGRMAGQFAKPHSQSTEIVDGVELPAFRGHLINSELPEVEARRPDPGRMLRCYQAGRKVMSALNRRRGKDDAEGPWSSHEALVLDYEESLVRQDPVSDERILTSTHLPWLGDRTRQPNAPHMRMLAGIGNSVGCKLGPTTRVDDVLRICAILDPFREPGRLVLIVRMGLTQITEVLPPLLAAVRRAGHPVVWLTDPMHGNTVRARTGTKTRFLADLTAEAMEFRAILERAGAHPGGLHLEVAANDVNECVGGAGYGTKAPGPYTSLFDPRLNREQALELIDAWS